MPQVTIYDIAQKAGVSIATVSRVMNNSKDISDKTRKRVRKIADELGYYPQSCICVSDMQAIEALKAMPGTEVYPHYRL